ncbi:M56 family metallopeptidase [Pedobacter boryungensis]|uniref:TonB family protein n=1 Tax=Pedobacter boryungensis TaxID=869962 RepID=A0ABX2DCL8_9SPHI|nr:M56 family metallopeptidase [Pedobacter boryungensis]NQX31831.1 TonB family protein [Pedobacter boryungensis]
MSWAHYLLQVNIYLIIFYCFYKLLLDKETYFVLNRIYLVSSGIFSLAIPFLRFELFSQKVVSDKLYISVSEINTVVSNYAILPQTQDQYDWGRLIVIIYIIGVFSYLLYFVYQLFAINTLFSRANANDAFSFFNRKSVAENLPERATVDLHEDIHIKQLHTIDVLFFEILAIITWFNPVIYFYKKSIKNIHEYLADEAAAKFQGDKETYALLLLSQAFGVQPSTLMNGFLTKSLIKKRIFMLHKQRSKKTAILKYGLFVPLFALTLVLSSATIRKNNQIIAVADQIPLNDASSVVNQVIKEPLSVVNLNSALKLDQVEVQDLVTKNTVVPSPISKDNLEKEKSNSWNGFYKFLADGIKYPAEAVKKKIQGNLIVNFAVNRGRVTDLVVQNELGGGCDEEVIQQISNYDDFFQKDGNYCLRVTFKLEGADSQFKNADVKLPEDYQVLQGMLITGLASKDEIQDNNVYSFVAMENPPSYPGGVSEFYNFLGKNIKYPLLASDNEIEGNVYVSFTVEKDGSLNDIKVDRKLGYGIDEEAVRVLKLSKRWNPGMQNGRPVRVKYNIPIRFSLNAKKRETSSTIVLKSIPNDKTPPLIILDGEIRETSTIKDLDPKTIAEISILKGASGSALYGKSGENGVILITSKKAKSTQQH